MASSQEGTPGGFPETASIDDGLNSDTVQHREMLAALGVAVAGQGLKVAAAAGSTPAKQGNKRQKLDAAPAGPVRRSSRAQAQAALERIKRGSLTAPAESESSSKDDTDQSGDADDGGETPTEQDAEVKARGGGASRSARGKGRRGRGGLSNGATTKGRVAASGGGSRRRAAADAEAVADSDDGDSAALGNSSGGGDSDSGSEYDGRDTGSDVVMSSDSSSSGGDDEDDEEEAPAATEPEGQQGEGSGKGGVARGRSTRRPRGGSAAGASRGGARGGGAGRGGAAGSGRGRGKAKAKVPVGQASGAVDGAADGAGGSQPAPKPRRKGRAAKAARDGEAGPGGAESAMPSEEELKEMWDMFAPEGGMVTSAGVLRVAAQLGLDDFNDPLLEAMMEFAREKIGGLEQGARGLTLPQFRSLLEALYNPQAPPEGAKPTQSLSQVSQGGQVRVQPVVLTNAQDPQQRLALVIVQPTRSQQGPTVGVTPAGSTAAGAVAVGDAAAGPDG